MKKNYFKMQIEIEKLESVDVLTGSADGNSLVNDNDGNDVENWYW